MRSARCHIARVRHIASLIEPEAHFHFAVHRRRIAEILAGALCLTDAAVELAQAEVAVGD